MKAKKVRKKKAKTPAIKKLTKPAVSVPRYAVAPRLGSRVAVAPVYFLGGGIVQAFALATPWQLAEPHPGPEYRKIAVRSVPTPEGPMRIARFVLRDEVRSELAARCEAVLAEEREAVRKRELNFAATQRILNRVCARKRTN